MEKLFLEASKQGNFSRMQYSGILWNIHPWQAEQGTGVVEQAHYQHEGQAQEDGGGVVHDHQEVTDRIWGREVVCGEDLLSVRNAQQVLGQSVGNVQPIQTQITDFWRGSDVDGRNSSNGGPPMWMAKVGKQYADFGLKKKRKSDGEPLDKPKES